jgi:hypothetical protein
MAINDLDRQALDRCTKLYAAKGGEFTQRVKERDCDWREMAHGCCFHFQMQNLGLRPWQNPPMFLIDDDSSRPEDLAAFKIMRKLIDAGLSVYEPDPLAALAAVKNRKGGGARFSPKPRTRK